MKTFFTFIFLTFVHFSVLHAQCSSDSVFSKLDIDDNGQRGVMFDITSNSTVTIRCFSPYIYLVMGSYGIYYRNGSFVGHENSSAGWTFLDSATNMTGTGSTPTHLPINVSVPILAGDTVAFYITCLRISSAFGGIRYLGSTATPAIGTVSKTDGKISALVGIGKAFPFGTSYTTRQFLGQIRYSNGISPLPLEMGTFDVKQSGEANLLTWETLQEVNVSHFDLEKSRDALVFEKIGKIEAIGSSNSPQDYQFEDNHVSEGRNYYRLKNYDIDGKFSYSQVISIENTESAYLRIFPNPFQEAFSITLSDYAQPFMMTDIYGKIIEKSNEVPKTIDTQNLTSGVYFLRIGGKSISVIKE